MSDEPEVVNRYAEGDPSAFGMAGRWNRLRVPFIGKESGALLIERNSRNGMEVRAEVGHLCAETTDGDSHYVAAPTVHICQGKDDRPPSSCCGQHAPFRHILVIPKHLAACLDLVEEDGRFATMRFMVDVVDDPLGRIRLMNRERWEQHLQTQRAKEVERRG